MTISEMHTLFDIIQDKYNAPYFIDSEKDVFINQAQYVFINEIIHPELPYNLPGGNSLSVLERSIADIESIQPIICSDLALTAALTTGLVSLSSINTAVDTFKDPTSAIAVAFKCMHILTIGIAATPGAANWTGSRKANYVRYNDYHTFQENVFKAASTRKIQYRVSSSGLLFTPIPTTAAGNILLTCISTPVAVSLSSAVDCELPSFTHNKILSIALEYAGVSSRDDAMMLLSKQVEVPTQSK